MPDAAGAESFPESRGAFASLHHRDFAVFWTSMLFSNSGTWMQMITVPFVLDELTHSATVVGLGAFFTYFPSVFAGPLGGSLSDRRSRRSVLFWSQFVMMLASLALFVLWTTGQATAVTIFVCVAISSTANGITNASMSAFATQLVPRADMLNAVRLTTMQFQGARAFGPGLAGIVLATLGPGAAFLINGLSYVVVLAGLYSVAARPLGETTPTVGIWTHFRDGVRYVRERRCSPRRS